MKPILLNLGLLLTWAVAQTAVAWPLETGTLPRPEMVNPIGEPLGVIANPVQPEFATPPNSVMAFYLTAEIEFIPGYEVVGVALDGSGDAAPILKSGNEGIWGTDAIIWTANGIEIKSDVTRPEPSNGLRSILLIVPEPSSFQLLAGSLAMLLGVASVLRRRSRTNLV